MKIFVKENLNEDIKNLIKLVRSKGSRMELSKAIFKNLERDYKISKVMFSQELKVILNSDASVPETISVNYPCSVVIPENVIVTDVTEGTIINIIAEYGRSIAPDDLTRVEGLGCKVTLDSIDNTSIKINITWTLKV